MNDINTVHIGSCQLLLIQIKVFPLQLFTIYANIYMHTLIHFCSMYAIHFHWWGVHVLSSTVEASFFYQQGKKSPRESRRLVMTKIDKERQKKTDR